MHELRSGPCPPQTLRGSVVEHRKAESEDLRSDSHGDMEMEKTKFSEMVESGKNLPPFD